MPSRLIDPTVLPECGDTGDHRSYSFKFNVFPDSLWKAEYDTQEGIVYTRLADLYCRHALASFGKQLHLADLVGDLDWHFDASAGLLSFGEQYRWHAQLLGTESEQSGTWLWGWANPTPGLSSALVHASLALKGVGDQQDIEELTQREVPLDTITGHFLALAASGVCRSDAYYRGPYPGGAAFILIKDNSFPRNPVPPLNRLAGLLPQTVSSIDIPDHKLALMGYLAYYGIIGEEVGSVLVVKEGNETVLRAEFDEQNRLSTLDVKF